MTTPWDALGNLIIGWVKANRVRDWMRLVLAIFGSAFVTLTGVWGATIWTLYAQGYTVAWSLTLGFASGLLSVSAVTLFLWRTSELTKGIPIAVPGPAEENLQKILEKENIVTSGERK